MIVNQVRKTPIEFKAQATNGILSFDVFDVIGDNYFGDGITAEAFKGAMDSAGDYSSIQVNVASPGGDLYQGVSIRNLLKQSGKPVNINVVGMCASAASLIATAGTVTMAPGTTMMLHEAQGMVMGDADAMTKMADTLSIVTNSAADLYVQKTGKSKADILAMMKEETWLTPDEAVKDGFADSVGGKKAAVQNSFDMSMFRNAPAELLNQAKTKEVDGEHLTSGDFVYVGNQDDTSTWSLPWHFSTEEKTQSHLRDALARFDQDEVIPESHKDEAYAKLLRLCKEHGIDVSRRGNPKNEVSPCTCVMDSSTPCSTHPDGLENPLNLLKLQLEINRRK